MNKLVDRNNLNKFSDMLHNIYENCKDANTKVLLDEAIYFLNIHILEVEKETFNEIKREIYFKMKNAKSDKEMKMYYDLYQATKG